MVYKCIECKEVCLEGSDGIDSIECDVCKGLCHKNCTKVSRADYRSLKSSKDKVYNCHKCNPTFHTNVNKVLSSKSNISSSEFLQIMEQLKEITKSMNFLSEKYDGLVKDQKRQNQEIKDLKKEVQVLKSENLEMQQVIKNLEADKVKTKIVIKANKSDVIPNPNQKVIDIARSIGISVGNDSIVSSHVVSSYTVESRRGEKFEKCLLMIDFKNEAVRNEILKNKKKLKDSNMKHIIIYEAFTTKTRNLFNYAKQLSAVGYKMVFVSRGKVFVKKDVESNPVELKTKDDVDSILSRSVL